MDQDLDRITGVICTVGKLKGVGPDEDFYAAGFSSINALELLLELETAFDVSIPDDEFIEARTPQALRQMVVRLKGTTG